MNEDPKQGLDELLDTFDRKQDEATTRAAHAHTRQDSFLDRFHSLREKVIGPLMHRRTGVTGEVHRHGAAGCNWKAG